MRVSEGVSTRDTVLDSGGHRTLTEIVGDDHAVLTVLRDGIPVGALDCEAVGTVTCGIFDAEGEWQV